MSKNPAQLARHVFPIFFLLWLAGCAGGSSDSAAGGGAPATGAPGGGGTTNGAPAEGTDYTIGGQVTGLSGTVALQNNGGNDLSLSANSAFAFTTTTVTGSNYRVTVLAQPAGQTCAVANGAGTVSGANVTDVAVTCSSSPASLALFAGDVAAGNVNGVGAAARFNGPADMAVDSAGNIYVADFWNFIIRKITPEGAVTTFAGTGGKGSADGIRTAASFFLPGGVATDSADNVYVADTHNNTIRKIAPGGQVTTLAGIPENPGNADGTGTAARFVFPQGMSTDSKGNIYVADNENNAIRKITPSGVVTTFAGAAAHLILPTNVATDSADNVYVADAIFHNIRKITPEGVLTTFAGTEGVSGSADGTGAAARFNFPCGVAADSAGNVYVSDTGNNTIRKITPDGVVSTVVGVAGQAGFTPGALPGLLNGPGAIVVSGTSLYVTQANSVVVVRNRP
ncbi:MAG TPA: NHL repeat-containing protein [Burkholderiales bacterium]|nr:NHL repeat-containing protein [Burkholderiales bacterium]